MINKVHTHTQLLNGQCRNVTITTKIICNLKVNDLGILNLQIVNPVLSLYIHSFTKRCTTYIQLKRCTVFSSFETHKPCRSFTLPKYNKMAFAYTICDLIQSVMKQSSTTVGTISSIIISLKSALL